MSDPNPPDAAQIRHDIEETRADLAGTVDALSAKLDVKAQAKTKAKDVKAGVTEAVAKGKQSAPPVVQNILDRAGIALAPAAAKARSYRLQIMAVATSAAAVALLARRRVRGPR
jgi:hypothetical protein